MSGLVREWMQQGGLTCRVGTRFSQIRERVAAMQAPGAVVVGEDGAILGVISRGTVSELETHAHRIAHVLAAELMSAPVAVVEGGLGIGKALEQANQSGSECMVVTDSGGAPVGLLSVTSLLRALGPAGLVPSPA